MQLVTETSSRARTWLRDNGYPYTDTMTLIKSEKTFSDGSLFGIEIPVVNSMDDLQCTLHWLGCYDVKCDRFNETKGSFLLSDSEIREMLSLCKEKNTGMVFSLSPRPEYDIKSSFYRTKFGLEQARLNNNNDSIAHSIEEAFRLTELGCRGLIVYDLGVLSILSEMRRRGLLPSDLLFKASSHCMASNPMITKILHEYGADSVTTIHDASLVVLQEMRRLGGDVVLDVPVDVYPEKGGFLRFNEVAEIVQVASPVFLKIGASAQSGPYDVLGKDRVEKKIKTVRVALEHLSRVIDCNATRLEQNNIYRCLPR